MVETKNKRVMELLKKLQEEQDRHKPFFSFNRDVCWNGEKCCFCDSILSPSKSGGRYVSSDEPDNDDEDTSEGVLFCGDCLEELQKVMDTDMG